MVDIATLARENGRRWRAAKLTRDFSAVARHLCAAKNTYKSVELRTGVPWFIVAVIHYREADQNWNASIAQGDPWRSVSVHEPAGRGPFRSWLEAAVDALTDCPPYAARWKDWSAGGALTLLEQYNGLGYAARGMPSPYVWSGTDQYVSGKYVADHVFDPNEVDRQLGCAGIVMAMAAIDPSIRFASPIASSIGKAAAGAVVAGTAAHQAGISPFIVFGIAIAIAAGIFIYSHFRKGK